MRRIIGFFPVLIIILVMIIGCLDQKHEDEKIKGFIYYIIINTTGNDNYTLYLPVPVKGYQQVGLTPQEPLDELDYLEVHNGIGRFEVISEGEIYFLKIESNSSCSISINDTLSEEEMPYDYFDTLSSNDLFLSREGNNSFDLDMFLSYNIGGTSYTWEIHESNLEEGWQNANIQPNHTIIG